MPPSLKIGIPPAFKCVYYKLRYKPEKSGPSARFFVPEWRISKFMGIFSPTAVRRRVTDLSPQFLSSLGVGAVLLDVDNTIATYTSHTPIPGAIEWAHRLVEEGFRVVIVSNNYKKRVGPFAARFGLDFISFALKPLPFDYLKARKKLKMKCRDCVIIGDQIFTDVVGANLCGMRSVLLTPIEPEEGLSFKIRRYFERGLRAKYEKRKDVLQ